MKTPPETQRWSDRCSRSQPGARARNQRPDAVADEREHDEHEPEDHELHRHVAGRDVHELRQEGEEEERRLRVQHVDDDPLAVDPPQAALAQLDPRLVALEQPPDPEHDQVHRARVLHDREGRRRREHERGEPDRGREDVDEPAGRDAERRDEAGAATAVDALSDDVEHGGAGNDDQRHRGGREEQQGRGLRHGLTIPAPSNEGSSPRRGAADTPADPSAAGSRRSGGKPMLESRPGRRRSSRSPWSPSATATCSSGRTSWAAAVRSRRRPARRARGRPVVPGSSKGRRTCRASRATAAGSSPRSSSGAARLRLPQPARAAPSRRTHRKPGPSAGRFPVPPGRGTTRR